jgi:hypothetical protein
MKSRVMKAIAVCISATMLLQPISVFAEDTEVEYNQEVVQAIDEAQTQIQEALPAPAEPQNETPAEPQVQDETPAEPAIIPQEPTDQHLKDSEKALEKIDETIGDYNETLEAAADAKDDYMDAVDAAQDSEDAFEQAVSDAGSAVIPAVISTTVDAAIAGNDADQVEQMANEVYATQADAEAAKAQANGIAAEAQQVANAAAATVEEFGNKLIAAEEAKAQADRDYNSAKDAYWDAVSARAEAENEYVAIMKKYGLYNPNFDPAAEDEKWGNYGKGDVAQAVREARAAYDSALAAESAAQSDFEGKKGEYQEAQDLYDKAVIDAANAQNELDEANANLEKAQRIEQINEVRKTEINTYNRNKDSHLDSAKEAIRTADIALAKSLLGYKLNEDGITDYELEDAEDGKFVVKYTDDKGEEITKIFDYSIDPKTYEMEMGYMTYDSGHWLIIDEVEVKTVETEAERYIFKDAETGEVVDISEYTKWNKEWYYKDVEEWVEGRYEWKYGRREYIPGHFETTRKWAKNTNRKETYTVSETKEVRSEFYKERKYWEDTKDITTAAAQETINGINNRINKPTNMKGDVDNKKQALDDAEDLNKKAATKLTEVEEAYRAVVAAAESLKELERAEHVSYTALTQVRKQYEWYVAALRTAEGAYLYAAFQAGTAQEEANRALKALEGEFAYETPTPAPVPGPAPVNEDTTPSEPAGPAGEPTDTTPDYTPAAPIAAATVAAPVAEPEEAVLGATRGNGAAAENVVAEGEGEEIREEVPAIEKKEEKKEEVKKPATTIDDEETAKAAAPIETKKGFPWWILIILALIVAVTIEEYNRRKNKENQNIQE